MPIVLFTPNGDCTCWEHCRSCTLTLNLARGPKSRPLTRTLPEEEPAQLMKQVPFWRKERKTLQWCGMIPWSILNMGKSLFLFPGWLLITASFSSVILPKFHQHKPSLLYCFHYSGAYIQEALRGGEERDILLLIKTRQAISNHTFCFLPLSLVGAMLTEIDALDENSIILQMLIWVVVIISKKQSAP